MKHTQDNHSRNVLVIGATGSTGRRIVAELLARGHRVTAFARRPDELDIQSPQLARHKGDAMVPADLSVAMRGHDAVCVVLGIRKNPLWVRFGRSGDTPIDVRSRGTDNVIAAMREHGVTRLLVQTTYGIGESEGKLPLKWRLLFSVFLKPQIEDSRVQELIVRESGLDWTLIQPVGLTDDEDEDEAFASTGAETKTFSVSRVAVARFFADAVGADRYRGATVALSAG